MEVSRLLQIAPPKFKVGDQVRYQKVGNYGPPDFHGKITEVRPATRLNPSHRYVVSSGKESHHVTERMLYADSRFQVA